jgi:hypothetical protein
MSVPDRSPWFEAVLARLPDGTVCDVRVGVHWTAVVVETHGRMACGLAATQVPAEHEGPTVAAAGRLIEHTGLELAGLIRSSSPTEASIGLAAINALLPPGPTTWGNVNAGEFESRVFNEPAGIGDRRTLVLGRHLCGGQPAGQPASRFDDDSRPVDSDPHVAHGPIRQTRQHGIEPGRSIGDGHRSPLRARKYYRARPVSPTGP